MSKILPTLPEENANSVTNFKTPAELSNINIKVIKGLTIISTILLDIAMVLIRKPKSEQKATVYKFNHIIRLVETLLQGMETNAELAQQLNHSQKMRLVKILNRLTKMLSS